MIEKLIEKFEAGEEMTWAELRMLVSWAVGEARVAYMERDYAKAEPMDELAERVADAMMAHSAKPKTVSVPAR